MSGSATGTNLSSWSYSKWLVQAFPPDRGEASERWAFGLYEILDKRLSPIDPRVLHVTYQSVVELDSSAIPAAGDPFFTPRLEEAVVEKFRAMQRRDGLSAPEPVDAPATA